MKPVTQTRTGGNVNAPGNCFPACIASIFEVSITDLPDEKDIIDRMRQSGDWDGKSEQNKRNASWSQLWIELSDWLFYHRGVGMIEVQYASGAGGLMHDDEIYCILGGKSPRGFDHAVVGKGGDIVHDPHPEGGGLIGKPDTITYFVACCDNERTL